MGKRRPGTTVTKTSRIGIYLTANTHKALQMAAIKEDTSVTDLVERLIADYLAGQRRRGPRPT